MEMNQIVLDVIFSMFSDRYFDRFECNDIVTESRIRRKDCTSVFGTNFFRNKLRSNENIVCNNPGTELREKKKTLKNILNEVRFTTLPFAGNEKHEKLIILLISNTAILCYCCYEYQ